MIIVHDANEYDLLLDQTRVLSTSFLTDSPHNARLHCIRLSFRNLKFTGKVYHVVCRIIMHHK